jgi:hypothetical protein
MNEDLLLGPYKLPLKKLSKEEGFGYFGAVSLAKDGKGIQCHVCGAIKNNLSLHLRLHKITVREYREKFGISLNTVLVSESCRNASVERMLALRAKLQKEGSLAAITRLCNERRIESMKKAIKAGTWKKHPMLKPEDLNLRGICPDQLIETIRAAHAHYGRTPSYAEYMGFHQTNRFATPIRRTFGSWKKAVVKAGYEPKKRAWSTDNASYDYEELIETLATFYKEQKRPPTLSDFKQGFLPNWETYTRHFGSMQEARRRAGVEHYVLARGGAHTP